jgi:hypothetical protein
VDVVPEYTTVGRSQTTDNPCAVSAELRRTQIEPQELANFDPQNLFLRDRLGGIVEMLGDRHHSDLGASGSGRRRRPHERQNTRNGEQARDAPNRLRAAS